MIKIVNQRSDLYHLHAYTRSSHHQKEISEMKRICDHILSLWVSQNETTISEEISAKISAYNHLHKRWEEEEYKKG